MSLKTTQWIGPDFGYFPEATKSWLIVKERYLSTVKEIFKDSKVNITAEGKRHLGATIGSDAFKDNFVGEKINELTEQLKLLSKTAQIEPQTAYTCFVSGF